MTNEQFEIVQHKDMQAMKELVNTVEPDEAVRVKLIEGIERWFNGTNNKKLN